jgi:ferredoxin-like protein FixX
MDRDQASANHVRFRADVGFQVPGEVPTRSRFPAPGLDRVIHTLGWPLRYGAKYREFGGSWIYPMGEDRVSVGFVIGLDYTDATVSGLIGNAKDRYPKPDGKYTSDKLSSVFISGNATRDDAPNHIRIQKHVPREIAETWRWMCPAGVYEIPVDVPEAGDVDVIVNYTNCVQCGAIIAKGGRLTTAEGGDGPLYQNL